MFSEPRRSTVSITVDEVSELHVSAVVNMCHIFGRLFPGQLANSRAVWRTLCTSTQRDSFSCPSWVLWCSKGKETLFFCGSCNYWNGITAFLHPPLQQYASFFLETLVENEWKVLCVSDGVGCYSEMASAHLEFLSVAVTEGERGNPPQIKSAYPMTAHSQTNLCFLLFKHNLKAKSTPHLLNLNLAMYSFLWHKSLDILNY